MTTEKIGRLLQAGVLAAAACLAVGLVLWFVGLAGAADTVLTAGLFVLMATPVTPVLVSLATYLRNREWVFVWATLAVLLMLAVTLWLALSEAELRSH
jgi:uncharacterized membrane protein